MLALLDVPVLLHVEVAEVRKEVNELVAREAVETKHLLEVKYCNGFQLILIRSWALGMLQVQYVALD